MYSKTSLFRLSIIREPLVFRIKSEVPAKIPLYCALNSSFISSLEKPKIQPQG